ncbi:hypothetical protein pb186bvf_019337 [Paramecium bursaria]
MQFQFARRRIGQTYRKTLGIYNFKIGHQQYHHQPGAVDVHTAESLKKTGKVVHRYKLHDLQQNSDRVFGEFVGRKFRFDKNKVPIYDVPDLTDFNLMPYVSHKTPKIEKDVLDRLRELNDFKITEIKPRGNLLVNEK